MINKKRRTGFTIVELVIVIAVIAILAAVLIPTFSSIIKKANLSADMVAVREMNGILAAEEIADGKPATVVDAQEVLKANGINDFSPMSSNNEFYWVGGDNRVLLWDVEETKVTYPDEYAKKYKNLTEISIDWHDLNGDYDVIFVQPSDDKTLADVLLESINTAESGDIIILPENSTINMSLSQIGKKMVIAENVGKKVTIDLNNSSINSIDDYTLSVPKNGELILKNGTINNSKVSGGTSAMMANTGSKIELSNIVFNANNGAALFPNGDASEVLIKDSTIKAYSYGVGTNASSSDNIHISITNTRIEAMTSVMINVPGLLEIDNCIIAGRYHGVLVRGGTAIIKNSDISNTNTSASLANYFENINWGTGNTVNLAAITIGNKDSISYQYPSNVTIINTKLTATNYPAMYAWANSGDGLGVTINYDNNCVFEGEVEYGNNGNNIVVNGASAATN